MLEFQIYWKKWWGFHFSSDTEIFDPYHSGGTVITHRVLCIGPFQWRWTS